MVTRRSRLNPAIGLLDLSTSLPWVKPEDAGVNVTGAVTSGNSAKLQSQIDALNASGGGVIRVTPGSKIWLDATVTLKEGVWIDGGGGSKQTTSRQSSTFIADHTISTGWIFDTPSTSINGTGIRCCRITTDMGTPSSIQLGGIRFQHVTYGILEHLSVGAVTDNAVKIGGTGCIINDVGGGYVPQGRTLTQPTGVLHINGTDHIVKDCEWFANATTITYSQLWQCAVYVNCLTTWFLNNEAEFGECGWYIDGPQSGGSGLGTSGAYLCEWIGSRATYNAGHGFYIAGAASYNQFVAPYVYNCSYAGDGQYDGFYIANGAIGTRIGKLTGASNNLAGQGGPGPGGRYYLMRYLYNDQNAAYTNDQANKIDDVWGQGDLFTVDTVNIASGAAPAKQGGGATTAGNRDKSRYHAGQTIWDLTLSKTLISTGSKWVDNSTGKLTQLNQLPPTYAENRQPAGATGSTSTTAWTVGKGTLTTEQKILQSSPVPAQFATPQLLKIVANASAVSAGECDFNTGVLNIAVDPTQDFSVGGYFMEGNVSVAGAATVNFNIAWYNSSATFLSSTNTSGVSVSNTTAVKVAADIAAASIPSTAAVAVITPIITKSGMVSGVDTFWATNFWAVQGAQLNYVAP